MRKTTNPVRVNRNFKALYLLSCLLFSSVSYAQFSFDIGATLAVSGNKTKNFHDERPPIVTGGLNQLGDTSFYAYSYQASGIGVFLYPKYQVYEFAKHGISVGAPINLGISGSTQTGTTSFMLDLNLSVDINGGNFNKKSGKDAPLGYYAGIGFGMTNTSDVGYELINDGSVTASTPDLVKINGNFEDPVDYLSGKTSGLLLHAGIGNLSALKKVAPLLGGLSFRFAYRPGLGSDKLSYYMATLFLHI